MGWCATPVPLLCRPSSIQRVAVWILENYYHDFPVYNPALLNLPKSVLSKKMSGFKVYSLGEGECFSSQDCCLLEFSRSLLSLGSACAPNVAFRVQRKAQLVPLNVLCASVRFLLLTVCLHPLSVRI